MFVKSAKTTTNFVFLTWKNVAKTLLDVSTNKTQKTSAQKLLMFTFCPFFELPKTPLRAPIYHHLESAFAKREILLRQKQTKSIVSSTQHKRPIIHSKLLSFKEFPGHSRIIQLPVLIDYALLALSGSPKTCPKSRVTSSSPFLLLGRVPKWPCPKLITPSKCSLLKICRARASISGMKFQVHFKVVLTRNFCNCSDF